MRTVLIGLAIFLAACGASTNNKKNRNTDSNPASPSVDSINFPLDGRQVVPKTVQTTGRGNAEFTFDDQTLSLSGTVTLTGITATKVHVHEGFAGQTGSLVTALLPHPTVQNSWTVEPDFQLTTAQAEQLLAGGLYVNVHSDAFPDGELRGQILPDGLVATKVELTPDQVVVSPNDPPVSSNASAVAGLTLFIDTGQLVGTVSISGLSPTKVHLHEGAAGTTGAMVVAFEMARNDLTTWRIPDDSALSLDQIQLFLNGDMYLNIHSVSYPSGELRGQVEP